MPDNINHNVKEHSYRGNTRDPLLSGQQLALDEQNFSVRFHLLNRNKEFTPFVTLIANSRTCEPGRSVLGSLLALCVWEMT